METIRKLLAEQRAGLQELTSEIQRKEVTPSRIVRLMKIVSMNIEAMERLASIVDRLQLKLPPSPDRGVDST